MVILRAPALSWIKAALDTTLNRAGYQDQWDKAQFIQAFACNNRSGSARVGPSERDIGVQLFRFSNRLTWVSDTIASWRLVKSVTKYLVVIRRRQIGALEYSHRRVA